MLLTFELGSVQGTYAKEATAYAPVPAGEVSPAATTPDGLDVGEHSNEAYPDFQPTTHS